MAACHPLHGVACWGSSWGRGLGILPLVGQNKLQRRLVEYKTEGKENGKSERTLNADGWLQGQGVLRADRDPGVGKDPLSG